MEIGAVYPQTEFGSDPEAIREYVQMAESLRYSHILAYDHVLGANPDRPAWRGPYTYLTPFQEPFVLFGFMAGVTTKIHFATGVIILPQRQTALVAKQAATLDILSGGRFRLGVGIGWNDVEYTSLGENFKNRGKRIEEQIKVMKELWAEPLVKFKGKWHEIPDAGINPLPVCKSIPIWMGGQAEPVLRRAAQIADGWMTNFRTVSEASQALHILDESLAQAGRPKMQFGLEWRISYGVGKPDDWKQVFR
jgi:probable F420-dependent oxidoreductase